MLFSVSAKATCGIETLSKITSALPIHYEIENGVIFGPSYDDHSKIVEIGKVLTIPKGAKLYHWGDEAMSEWAEAGFPSDNTGRNLRNSLSGYFASLDTSDSAQYGPYLIVSTAKKDLKLSSYNGKAYWKGKKQSIEDYVHLDGTTDGYPDGEKKWIAVNHPFDSLTFKAATEDDLYASEKFLGSKFTVRDFLFIDTHYHVTSNAKIQLLYPDMDKILRNLPMTRKEMLEFAKKLRYSSGIGFLWKKNRVGPLMRNIKARLPVQVIEEAFFDDGMRSFYSTRELRQIMSQTQDYMFFNPTFVP